MDIDSVDSVWETAYEVGVNAGIKQIENKIQEHCELGKPILANGELYWLKDSKQHLVEIMDSLDELDEVVAFAKSRNIKHDLYL